jgi:hypothetical protein
MVRVIVDRGSSPVDDRRVGLTCNHDGACVLVLLWWGLLFPVCDVDGRGELRCSGLAVADQRHARMAGNSEVALSFARASFGFDFTRVVSLRSLLTSLHL